MVLIHIDRYLKTNYIVSIAIIKVERVNLVNHDQTTLTALHFFPLEPQYVVALSSCDPFGQLDVRRLSCVMPMDEWQWHKRH